jgi:glucose/arabinose dehydrogenase/PKD repeat protein
MRRVLVGILATSALAASTGTAAAATYPAGFSEQTVFTGLTNPTAVRFAPDGRVFVAEKSGLIKVFDGLGDTSPTVFADLRTQVHNFWDRGLLGMALDPSFATRPYVYVLYAHDALMGGTAPRWGTPGATSDGCPSPPGATADGCVVSGRLSRLTASGNAAVGAEQVLIENWCQQYPSHSVGSLAFGADGALYVSGGDGASFNFVDWGQDGSPLNPCGDPPGAVGSLLSPPTAEGGALRSQDLRTASDPTSLDGAVLRVNPDTGAAMPNNPLAASSDLNTRRIVAYGLRNPFRLTVRPGTSEVWLGDVGWNTWEEIDRVTDPSAGVLNFGWPCYEGNGRQSGYDGANLNICENLYTASGAHTTPYFRWDHGARVVTGETCPTGSSSAAGVAFAPASGGPYPDAYDGALFFADYSRDCIWVMKRSTGPLPDPANVETFAAGAANPVELQTGPGGDLFFPDFDGGTVKRVVYTAANQPPVAVADGTPRSGPAPLTVNFSSAGTSDPDGDPLAYAWDLDGDGQYDDSTAANPTWTYSDSGDVTTGLRVSDGRGGSNSTSLVISPGNTAPVATITAPLPTDSWAAGDQVQFAGGAGDTQDGALSPSALSWSLIVHHCPSNCHTHPIQTWDGVAGASFAAPDHEYPSWLELRLTARDSKGLTDTKSLRLDPRTLNLTLDSSPRGLRLNLNGGDAPTPFTRQVIEGSRNTIGAAGPQALNSKFWSFDSWSDGGAAVHDVTVSQDMTLVASYQESARTALLVVKSADALGAGDAAVKARLESLGYLVTVASETVPASDAAGKSLVLISSTVGSSALQTRFRDLAVPVVLWEGALYDDMGMTSASGSFYGETGGLSSLAIADASHPAAGGLTGTPAVTTAATTLKWGRAGTSAFKVATLVGDATRTAVFGYETGAAMPGLAAPARRAALFLHDTTASVMTAQGWTLFDATVNWAAGGGSGSPPPPPPPPPPPEGGSALLVVGSTLLGAGDRAVFDRLTAADYAVEVIDDGLSTSADAIGKDVVLISSTVTGSLVGSRFRDSAAPVILWEGALFDDMGMTTNVGAFQGTATQSAVQITNALHPLAAGLTGTVSVTGAATALKWGRPSSAAVKAAIIPGNTARSVVWGYDAGTAMPGLAAPARRAATFFDDTTAANLTADGWRLFDANVRWAQTGS